MSMAIRRYDATAHQEAVAREAALTAQLDALRTEIHDLAATDEVDEGKAAKHGVKANEFLMVSAERESARNLVARMEQLEPARVKARADAPLARFLRKGFSGLEKDEIEAYGADPEDVGGFGGGRGELFRITSPEAQTRSDNASGQELVEETVQPTVVERLAHFGGLDRMAFQIMTSTGNELRWPQMDNASEKGTILAAQGTAVVADDLPNFGVVTFGAKTCSSNPIRITREMIQDSIIDIAAYAERASVRRMGRAWDDEFTVDGTQSVSLQEAADEGRKLATAGTLIFADVVEWVYSVDRAYRVGGEQGEGGYNSLMGGRRGFLISDGLEKNLVAMVDGDMRPLWLPSIRDGEPNMLIGWPYEVSGAIDGDITAASNTKIGYFGDFSYMGIRTVGTVEIFRFFDSRTAQTNQVECLGFSRRDARPMGAGAANKTDAIKALTTR